MNEARCSCCDRPRGEADWLDYDPMQVVRGSIIGWYSGDDGELCSMCMTVLMRTNRPCEHRAPGAIVHKGAVYGVSSYE